MPASARIALMFSKHSTACASASSGTCVVRRDAELARGEHHAPGRDLDGVAVLRERRADRGGIERAFHANELPVRLRVESCMEHSRVRQPATRTECPASSPSRQTSPAIRLANARVPVCLVADAAQLEPDADGLAPCDIVIDNGRIAAIGPARAGRPCRASISTAASCCRASSTCTPTSTRATSGIARRIRTARSWARAWP